MIRQMNKEDVTMVVSLHLASFSGFFLSLLGPKFLRLYYCGVCAAPEGICYVFLNTDRVAAGFVVGSSNPRGFYSRLLKRDWFRFSLASLGAIVRRPSSAGRIARALYHPGENPEGAEVAGLFSVAVHPELQGTGAGKELVTTFLNESKARGCSRVFLTTDRDDNVPANEFYRKLGFRIERQYETREGRRMNEYWISV